MKFSIFVLAALASDANGLITFGEKCPLPVIPTQGGFEKSRYLGRWYAQKQDFRFSGPCTTATYKLKPDGDIEVDNRGWVWWFFFSYYSVNGIARCPTNDGKCWVTFNLLKEPPDVTAETAGYNILSTDYDNYTIVYNCRDQWYGKEESAWIMTRKADVTSEYILSLEGLLREKMPSYKQTVLYTSA